MTTKKAGSTDEIRKDIERTRGDLGDTTEALAAKADVKERAKDGVAAAKDRTKEGAEQVAETVRRRPVPVFAMLASVAAAIGTAVMIRRRRATKSRLRNRLPWKK